MGESYPCENCGEEWETKPWSLNSAEEVGVCHKCWFQEFSPEERKEYSDENW